MLPTPSPSDEISFHLLSPGVGISAGRSPQPVPRCHSKDGWRSEADPTLIPEQVLDFCYLGQYPLLFLFTNPVWVGLQSLAKWPPWRIKICLLKICLKDFPCVFHSYLESAPSWVELQHNAGAKFMLEGRMVSVSTQRWGLQIRGTVLFQDLRSA